MFTTIKHLPEKEMRTFPIDEKKRVERAKELYRKGVYVSVADVMVGGSLKKVLNEAYRLTNSVDTSWFKNPEIWVEERAKKGCRSTSVGDVIIISGAPYMVAGCGFTYIGDVK